MDVLQAIRFIIQAWGEINSKIIHNCWWHTKILPNVDVDLRNISENICQNERLMLDNLTDALQALNLPNPMQVEEFLNIPEEKIVYEIPELVSFFKNTDKENINLDEMNDSNETTIISTSTAIASLETVYKFLLQ
ncbi:hypothetical protein RclHR1_22080003 [Rhizophagus clarus]|uniref:DDE-1 domain-containing protein n=1 Tax=Rhizophagus clarus TaxID=94130 RepID=A0A2Z6R9N6_9GLOM|nr:hypothetical protein RclHR1_22080003 [Rhizophagus clarus]GES79460.1 hypothetical protein GLOIN_2v1479386 [Rhizophagus clarus]